MSSKLQEMSENAAYDALVAHDIKPSVQRLAVMGYLSAHHTHPTADEIYNALVGQIPTLSKTTVYNTLRLFVRQGAATMLTIDGHNACFDGVTTPHAHFLCRCCGRVFDVPAAGLLQESASLLPEGFRTESVDLYYRGLCHQCANN